MIKFGLPEIRILQSLARDQSVETCAAGLVAPITASDGSARGFIVRDLSPVPADAYIRRSELAASLKPEFCIDLANRARREGVGVLLAHTHPGANALQAFSSVDDAGERPLAEYFGTRIPTAAHFTAVITSTSFHVRHMGQSTMIVAASIGREIERSSAAGFDDLPQIYDRQVRAFGLEGQCAIQGVRVGIVGLGGTGSVVAQQLAYLGVASFLLIDLDQVEETNLNRLVGAIPGDIGDFKVRVAARHISAINPKANCTEIVGDVLDERAASELAGVDFIFCCTDSMASRALLNQLAYQYLIPCIDMGVGIGADDGRIGYISGRVQMLSPGLPCLVCTDKLDAEQVRRELMTEEQRRVDPYIVGQVVPQPAVISLNSTVSSAAVTMFLAAVTGVPSEARMLTYDGMRGSLRPAAMDPRPQCIVCSSSGALAKGQAWDLPKRTG